MLSENTRSAFDYISLKRSGVFLFLYSLKYWGCLICYKKKHHCLCIRERLANAFPLTWIFRCELLKKRTLRLLINTLEYSVSCGHPKSGIPRFMSDRFSVYLGRQERHLLDIVSSHQASKFINTFMGIKKINIIII